MKNYLEIKNLDYSINSEHILNDVNFNINKKGEIVGILSAVMIEFHWMTFAVGTENILDFMENSGYEVR